MFVRPIVSAFSQFLPSPPAYRPFMNIQPPNDFRGRGFGFPSNLVDHHGGPPALAWVIFALQLLMLAALALLIVRSFTGRRPRFAGGPPPGPGARRFVRHGPPGPPDPLTHVRMRYASGDITRDEYLEKTRDLGGTPEEPTEELPAD
jgi:hypothetical protein